ncbi:sensor histidine kinase [Niastella sp. OAS944]|uniref:sensor histidine kinase n=1 Tax=Niastella sp. OAS944 TaxID=2664089 RepID=UPI00349244AA|nr:signal transduction histidine kinase [Chitinophagaceae bacterium OAS944]
MNEKKIRLYSPIFLFLFTVLFFMGMYIRDIRTAVLVVIMSAFYCILATESARLIFNLGRKKYPGLINTKSRVMYALRIGIPFLILVPVLEEAFTVAIGFFPLYKIKWGDLFWDYLFMVGLNVLGTAVVVGLFEGLYYIQNWKVLYAESERLKQINMNSQYQFLKDQVKPHFLFNSLNTLASLIGSDAERAEKFVMEMSAVYRYLLSKKETELALLRDELKFLNSYVLMLKTRFADSLQMQIDIDEQEYEYLLPPFVLQLLVENAVKHNVVSREMPLCVTITNDDKHNLIIANNIQRKRKPEPSERTGLTNLITRYQLLKKEEQLCITDDGEVFRIVLPLIETSVYEAVVLS